MLSMSPLHLSAHPFPTLANETLSISISHLKEKFLSETPQPLLRAFLLYYKIV